MNRILAFRALVLALVVSLGLAGCGSPLPPIPDTPAASVESPADARALFNACLKFRGVAASCDRLHDVNRLNYVRGTTP